LQWFSFERVKYNCLKIDEEGFFIFCKAFLTPPRGVFQLNISGVFTIGFASNTLMIRLGTSLMLQLRKIQRPFRQALIRARHFCLSS